MRREFLVLPFDVSILAELRRKRGGGGRKLPMSLRHAKSAEFEFTNFRGNKQVRKIIALSEKLAGFAVQYGIMNLVNFVPRSSFPPDSYAYMASKVLIKEPDTAHTLISSPKHMT